MNKKRLIVALVFVFGLNFFGVNFIRNDFKVEALSGDELKKFNIIELDNLKISTKNLGNEKVEVTLDNINAESISRVICNSFKYEGFKERANLDKNPPSEVTGRWENKKIVLENLKSPGIYTGNILITFKDGRTKAFRISVVKKPSDVVTYKVEIKNGNINLSDLKLNGESFTPSSVSLIFNGEEVKKVEFGSNNSELIIPIISPFNDDGKNYYKCTLKINYGDKGLYNSISDMYIEKKDGKVKESVDSLYKVVSTNGSFRKLTSNTGEVIINGEGIVGDLSKTTLSIPGAKSYIDATRSKESNKLIFKVIFDREITSKETLWTLNAEGKILTGKVDLTAGSIFGVNSIVKFQNNSNTLDTFSVIGDFTDPLINEGNKKFVNNRDLSEKNLGEVRLSDLDEIDGNSIVSERVSGKYQGKYYGSFYTNVKPMDIKIIGGLVTGSNSVKLTIDADFIKSMDYKNVTSGRIEYRDKTDNEGTWITSNAIFTTGEKGDINESPIVKEVTGLISGRSYDFRVVYSYADNNKVINVYSNNYPLSIEYSGINPPSKPEFIGGVITVQSNSNNTVSASDTVNINMPEIVKYDSTKPIEIVDFYYKDDNGTIVKQEDNEFSNVKVSFDSNKIIIDGLVPGKKYSDISFNYTDDKGEIKTMVIKNPYIEAPKGSSLEYLANVYESSLGRSADEVGYHFHLDNLVSKKTKLREFLLNMLSEKEFISLYKTPESKIEALYSAIVSREADEEGKAFWLKEYNKVLPNFDTEEDAIKFIANRMVNEKELEELAGNLGFDL